MGPSGWIASLRAAALMGLLAGSLAGCVGTIPDGAELPGAGAGPGGAHETTPGSGTPGAPNGGVGGAPGTAGNPTAMPDDPSAPVDFFRDIQPILGDYCVRCHGGVRELGTPPLNLQGRDRALVGRPSVFAQMLARVTLTDPNQRMPLGGQPLPADKIDKLRRWVVQGAPWPQHWAFAPVADVQPSQVAVSNEAWVRTPIDRFVLSRLDKAGLKPAPEADATTLLRRVSLDLVGLPPTPKEVDDFAADKSATAYEKVVDRLLASPAFGERWGRHWLDQARYADSDGYEKDLARMNAWRWRDWVVDAFNSDMPFDQFTTEQIAGDLLPGAKPLQVLATAFHNQTLLNREGGADPEEDRTKRVIDRVATIGNVWLGLTLQCTQCHSHPYDSLAQRELYRMYAFFNNADERSIKVPVTADPADTRVMDADVMGERAQNRRSTYLLTRGDFLNPDKTAGVLSPGTPAALHPFAPRAAQADRLDLARWLVDAKNPLTARVTVNTIWYHLFGRGLVPTLSDFGTRASLPSHPEMLDWLATDFVKGGWLRKRVIKQMVMSAVYRQSAAFRADATDKDPDNVLLSRQNRVRVEAEIVTDVSLAASGLLTRQVGGPTVFPPLNDELRGLVMGAYASFQWKDSTGPDRYRRGLYTFHKRGAAYPNLAIFDWPAADVSVTGRGISDTPLQALTTLHNTVFAEAAQALARRVQTDKAGSPLRDQLVWAMRLAIARTPTDEELTELASLYADAKKSYDADPAGAAKAVGAFQPAGVGASDAAAWVATARVILNLDELITRE